jgi:hypothetical protein
MSRYVLILLFLLSPAAYADNPFGLMLRPAPGQDLSITAAQSAALGGAWYRPPTLFVDRWHEGSCPACRALERSGLLLAVTIRNGGGDRLNRRPAIPPADIDAFGKNVESIIEHWKPAMLVIEDEENNAARYADGQVAGVWDSGSGTALGYGRELDRACRPIVRSDHGLDLDHPSARGKGRASLRLRPPRALPALRPRRWTDTLRLPKGRTGAGLAVA